jgi:hypothetical protein
VAERELHSRIGAALDEFTPPPAPVQAVIRKGRGFRLRRRAGALAGLAAAVALIAAGPSLAHAWGRNSPMPSSHRHKVTVGRVGPQAPHGLIATGTIDSEPWSIMVRQTGQRLCIVPSDGIGQGCQQADSVPVSGPSPVTFLGGGDSRRYYLAGPVATRVTRVSIRLTNGVVLRLWPVRYGTRRWVGVELPGTPRIARATAYAGTREIAYAVPFDDGQVLPSLLGWLRPGQREPATVTWPVGSGVSDGWRWSASVHDGPWGRCSEMRVAHQATDLGCSSPGASAGVMLSSPGGRIGGRLYPRWWLGQVEASIRYLRFALSDGSTMRVDAAPGGTRRFYAVVLSRPSLRIVSWAGFDAAGQRVSGGTGLP